MPPTKKLHPRTSTRPNTGAIEMNKTIMRRLLLALAGACALDLRAAPAWTTADVEPTSWTALSGNRIVHLTGTKSGTISTGYGC